MISSCDSPRDNPFDPNSDLYVPSQPPAKILEFSADAIEGDSALISWLSPDGANEYILYFGQSDWSGISPDDAELYSGILPGVLPAGEAQSYWIKLQSIGEFSWSMYSLSEAGLMSQGSDTVIIETGKWDNPAEIITSIRTIRVAREWNPTFDLISLDVVAEVNDPDGIDSVALYSQLTWVGKLTLRNGGLEWGSEFFGNDFPNESIERLIGHELNIKTFDMAGFVSISDPIDIIRVIDFAPIVVSPSQDTVGQNPVLEWEPYITELSFTYSIQVIHISGSGIETKLIHITGIDPALNSYQVSDHLTTEEDHFRWTVAVIDEFGNEARSTKAKFLLNEE